MIPKSREVRFEVSTICNYACKLCPHDWLRRRQEIMSNELFISLLARVEKAEQYDTVTFSGVGEPLIDPGLWAKVDLARHKGFRTLLLTNGSLLSKQEISRLQMSGLESIRVSMFGTDPETYSKAHGVSPELFHLVEENVLNASLAENIKLILTYNAIPNVNDSEEQIEKWIKRWAGHAKLEVWRPHNWSYAKHYRPVQDDLSDTCGRPFNGPLQIQVDGTVVVCCFDHNGVLQVGDLKTHDLEDIFNSDKFAMIHGQHQSGQHTTICEKCDQRNTDKSDVMIHTSDIISLDDRVQITSTTYGSLQT